MVTALSVTSQASRLAPDWSGEVPARLVRAAADVTKMISA
ncbi:MAG: hypothetical protein H7238_09710 [Polaromonas sp.]|nr:hypothetical protein [Polaromonas sp.]